MTRTSSPGLHDWPCTTFSYRSAVSATTPLVEISIGIDSAALPDRDADPPSFAAVRSHYVWLADWFAGEGEDAEAPLVSVDTGGALMPGATSRAANGRDLSEALAAYSAAAADWLSSPRGDAPVTTLTVATSMARPGEWPSDLHPLNVSVAIADGWQTSQTIIPPAQDLAATLERTYDNYNGAGGRLKVAFGEDGGVWLCRWGAGGTSVAIRERELPVFWAPAPLSRTVLSAMVDGRRYEGVDLQRWLATFLAAMQSLPLHDSTGRAARAEIAAAAAKTLAPVWRTAGDLPNASAACGAAERHLSRDLTAPLTCIVQFPAVVQSSIGPETGPSPGWRVGGDVTDAQAGADLPLTTDGIPLTAGDPSIEIVVAAPDTPGRARAELDLGINATRLDTPDGAALHFATPMAIPAGAVTCPLPLTALPTPAVIASAAGTQDRPRDGIDLAQLWAFSVSIPWSFAAQDALVLALRFNPADTPSPAPATPAPSCAPIFDALARFMVEWPSLAPKLGTGDERAAVDRALALAAGVRDGLTAWTPAEPQLAQSDGHEAIWRYTCELARETGMLTLRGEPSVTGSPVWPSIAGYAQDAPEAGALSATYRREAAVSSGSLELSWGQLAFRSVHSVAAEVSVARNHSIGPAGARVNPALILASEPVATLPVTRPPLLVDGPVDLPPSSSIEGSLTWLFNSFLAAPRGAHAIGTPADIEVQITIAYSFIVAGEIRARLPVLHARTPLSYDNLPVIGPGIAAQIRQWHSTADPAGQSPRLEIDLSVFTLDAQPGGGPAARVRQAILPVAL